MAISLGPDWQSDLWASPYRLRFKLSSGDRYVNMFVSAYDRARVLARAALPGEIMGVVAAWPGALDPKSFKTLKDMGVSTKPSEASWRGHFYPSEVQDDEASPWAHRAIRLDWDLADILLWSSIAMEIGVTPHASVSSKLVDLDRGVVVYAYDDRGMDIVALSPEPIAGLYGRFDSWLLDDDRPRMAQAFGDRPGAARV